ncbi:MAG: hypothetical protein QGH83_16305 [Candidatus Pacebacteria bacterium]|jgi:preprotein translocase subunit YajC|nr:hypothetical protein [Candidatus Paceibacterota bacterium]MDP7648238.1 hypothetical protein [Candidatus Paceibacterota bacterium]
MKRIKIGKKRKRRKPYFVRPEQKRRKSERKLFGKLMRGAVLCLSNGLQLSLKKVKNDKKRYEWVDWT